MDRHADNRNAIDHAAASCSSYIGTRSYVVAIDHAALFAGYTRRRKLGNNQYGSGSLWEFASCRQNVYSA